MNKDGRTDGWTEKDGGTGGRIKTDVRADGQGVLEFSQDNVKLIEAIQTMKKAVFHSKQM